MNIITFVASLQS